MKFKEIIIKKANEAFKKLAVTAVYYAENLLGNGTGATKKEIAIDYLLSKLPICIKPFIPFFRESLIKLADSLIEKAVEKLHKYQNLNGECSA